MSARVRVDEVFRGPVEGEVLIYTNSSPTSCGMDFEEERTYLIFAAETVRGLVPGLCAGNRSLSRAVNDLNYLRGLREAKPEGRVFGSVSTNRDDLFDRSSLGGAALVKGVSVTAMRGRRKWKTRTDAKGRYEILGLPPGDYRISAKHRNYLIKPQYEFNLTAGACAERSLGNRCRRRGLNGSGHVDSPIAANAPATALRHLTRDVTFSVGTDGDGGR